MTFTLIMTFYCWSSCFGIFCAIRGIFDPWYMLTNAGTQFVVAVAWGLRGGIGIPGGLVNLILGLYWLKLFFDQWTGRRKFAERLAGYKARALQLKMKRRLAAT